MDVEPRFVIIEWPRPVGGAMPAALTRILDAETAALIPTVTHMVIADAADLVVVEATQLVGEDGQPLTDGAGPHVVDGEVATGVFRYLVAEMRVGASDG